MRIWQAAAKMIVKVPLLFAVVVVGLSDTKAQSIIDQYNHRLQSSQFIAPLGPNFFGEQTDMRDGNTTFKVTDVQVPSNGSIPVSVGRTLVVSAQYTDRQGQGVVSHDRQFGQFWDLDVPYMKGTFDLMRGWVGRDPSNPQRVASASQNRCTLMGEGPPPTMGVGYFSSIEYDPSQFFSGIVINIPGHGTEQIVKQAPRVINGKTYYARTASNWQVGCSASLQNGTGEGFEVLIPDGTQYRFDWRYSRRMASINDATCNPGESIGGIMPSLQSSMVNWYTTPNCLSTTAIPRNEEFLYATLATDRFGNAVSYGWQAYTPSGGQPQSFLAQIVASDGARISLNYNDQGRIASIVADGKTWTYSYGQGYFGYSALQYVTLPGDNGKWSYAYGTGMVEVNEYDPAYVWRGCRLNIDSKTTAVVAGADESNVVTVSHPSGASGTFEFRKVLHGTKQAEAGCRWVGGNWFNTGGYTAILEHSSAYQVPSLYRKTVTGPGTTTQQWNYFYQPGWNAPYQSVTTVAEPGGVYSKYTYGNNCVYPSATNSCQDYGLLLKVIKGAGNQVLRTEVFEYLQSAAGQNYPANSGVLFNAAGYWYGGAAFNYNRPLYRSVVTQDGVNFARQVNVGCTAPDAYCFDSSMRPTSFTQSSALVQ
jgi:hypothetical protein